MLFAAATAIGFFFISAYVFPKSTTWLLLGSLPWLLLALTVFHLWAPRGGQAEGEEAWPGAFAGQAPFDAWGMSEEKDVGIGSGQVGGTLVLRLAGEVGPCRYVPVWMLVDTAGGRVSVGRPRHRSGDRVERVEACFGRDGAELGVIRFGVRRSGRVAMEWASVSVRVCGRRWFLESGPEAEFVVEGRRGVGRAG